MSDRIKTPGEGFNRVLIADVDSDYQIIFSSLIAVLGETPVVVRSGEEAVAVAQEGKIDLAIIDTSMPGMDSLEVCRQIKSVYPGEFIPVLIIATQEVIRDKVRALTEGADDFIAKPFIYEELQARIEALLRIRRLHNSLHRAHKELQDMQNQLVAQERQLAVGQLAATAAHQLGQPLSAILLNCFLLEQSPKEDAKFKGALAAIKSDVDRMSDMIDRLRSARADSTAAYVDNAEMLDVSTDESPREHPED
jgi:DNA-binding response OmpR family regulator